MKKLLGILILTFAVHCAAQDRPMSYANVMTQTIQNGPSEVAPRVVMIRPTKEQEGFCQGVGAYAATVVQFRDMGAPITQAVSLASQGDPDQFARTVKMNVIHAVYNDREWTLSPKRAQDLAYTGCIQSFDLKQGE